jgi:hypothetical protein
MPTRFRDLSDTDLQNISSANNKNVVKFNSTTSKFDVVTADSIVSAAATSIPQEFVDIVEEEIDINNVSFSGLDAGTF